MEENQIAELPTETRQNTGKKNLGVIISFIIVLLIISVVLIAKVYPHVHQNQQQTMNREATTMPVANVMNTTTPTPNTDVSNTQLDQDLQNAQGSLNGLDTNLNTNSQTINNQAADTPQ